MGKIVLVLAILSSIVLAGTTSFECKYEKYSNGKKIEKTEFYLTFLLDSGTGKAYMIGNNGTVEVVPYVTTTNDGFSFLEVTPAQNLMTTSIDKHLKSIHSRHTNIDGELVPSQYYGTCIMKK